MRTEVRDERFIMSDYYYFHALVWDEKQSLLWYWPLTWLCMNLRLIPSSVTCSSPPSPVFMSWTGNSPPSSGPEGKKKKNGARCWDVGQKRLLSFVVLNWLQNKTLTENKITTLNNRGVMVLVFFPNCLLGYVWVDMHLIKLKLGLVLFTLNLSSGLL